MRTKKIWTVIYTTPDGDELGNLARFSNARDAESFAQGKRQYSEPATPFCDEVPLNIARRWGF